MYAIKEYEVGINRTDKGVLYKRLLKLVNSLQTPTIDNFLTIMFQSRLQFYLPIATARMK